MNNEPGFPYLGFCPIEVYAPDKHNPDECEFCKPEFDGDAYDAGERAYELGRPNKCPYPADDRRAKFWHIGYDDAETIDRIELERTG